MPLGHYITRKSLLYPQYLSRLRTWDFCGKIRAAVTEDELRRAYLIFVIFVTFVTFVTKCDRFPQINMAA